MVLLCVLIISLGTTSWFNIRQYESNILHETTRHGEDLTRIVSEALTYSVIGYDYHTIQLLLEEIAKSQDVSYVRVLSEKGNVMAETGKAIPDSQLNTFTKDIIFENRKVGHLTIGIDNASIVKQLEMQKYSMITREAVIVLLIAIGEFLALSYIIVRPVSIITRSLDESIDAEGQITQSIPLMGKDEFGKLATQFNAMRLRLNDANTRMQSKIELADSKLTASNSKLQQQAEELQHINKELQRLATTDSLTGLYNRRYFDEVISTELALAERHGDVDSILMIDVDHFKKINDLHGHRGGNQVLMQIAQVLLASSRKTDLLCRIGGEEFILLCRRTGAEESMLVAEKIRQNVAAHIFAASANTNIQITVSIGVALLRGNLDADVIDDYVHQADLALYQSKNTGRNTVTHYKDIKHASDEETS